MRTTRSPRPPSSGPTRSASGSGSCPGSAWPCPHFLTLGPHDEANRSGPAIWLRCVLAGKVPGVAIAPGTVPVLYLPGVSRPTLRATEECPGELKPLAELQYRGVFWSQVNGKDWTVTAFLQSEHGGLGLKLPRDAATAASIRRSLDRLVDVPVAELRAKSSAGELNSLHFDSLVSDDLLDDLLTWLSDPKGTRDRWEPGRWETLCSRCRADYGFDPDRDGELAGAERLGLQETAAWKSAWKRYAAVPSRYPGLLDLLRKARPSPRPGDLLGNVRSESWPQDNDAHEQRSPRGPARPRWRSRPASARERLKTLEQDHAPRREWVWSRLGRSPLARAIASLATLAEVTTTALTGAPAGRHGPVLRGRRLAGRPCRPGSPGGRHHAPGPRRRLRSHRPRLQALAPRRRRTVPGAGRRRAGARAGDSPPRRRPGRDVPVCSPTACGSTSARCSASSWRARSATSRWGTTWPPCRPSPRRPSRRCPPSPGRSPARRPARTSAPAWPPSGKDLTPDRFRRLLEDAGYQVLSAHDTGDPQGRAWTEFGNIDQTGHNEGIGLAHRIPELVRHLVQRIEGLLAAGWQEVRVVTDHGWLLMPGGLPKADLPKYLTETRWRRCAVVKGSATVDLPCFAWFWSEPVRIASPPGIDCFLAGEDYNHGGLSLQECVVPRISVRGAAQPASSATIEGVKWSGLRCRVKVTGDRHRLLRSTSETRPRLRRPRSPSPGRWARTATPRSWSRRSTTRARAAPRSSSSWTPRGTSSTRWPSRWVSVDGTGSPRSIWPPTPSTGSSSARTSSASSPASTRCRPTSASSSWAATAPASTRRRSRRACRSSSGSCATGRSAAARRNSSRPAPRTPAASRSSTSSRPASTPRPTPTSPRCPACNSRTSASSDELVRDHERMLTGGLLRRGRSGLRRR